MSRIGNQHVAVPEKVKVRLADGTFFAEGPLGKEQVVVHPRTEVKIQDAEVVITPVGESFESKHFHGMMRALIANAVNGVSIGFKKELDINGVGYRADLKGKALNLVLGFSHNIQYPIPDGIQVKVDKQTHLIVSGSNKELVGRVASEIRGFRPPEPYKGKGIKYVDEIIIRKVGKAAGGKTAA